MCGCILSTKTSTLIKQSFSLGFFEGQADAVGGLDCRPLTLRDAKRAMPRDCRCSTARQARKFIAQAHRMGYKVGWFDLFADEVAARGADVSNIEEARAAKVARAATASTNLAVND